MLFIVRHGQSNLNKRGLMCGRTDADLTYEGLAAAYKRGDELKDIKFDYAFSSPLNRAKKTLSIILSKNLHKTPDVILDDRVIERDFGYFEGETANTNHEFTLRWNLDFDAKKVKMESFEDLLSRVASFLQEIKAECFGKNVIVATHNGVIRALRYLFNEGRGMRDLTNLGVKNVEVLNFPL